MSKWTKFRDKYVKPVAAAATLNPAIITGTIAGTAGNPVALGTVGAHEVSKGGKSDVPGVDEARGVYEDVTGQTAADAAKEAARVQREGMEYAADIQKEMYEQTREDYAPWRQAGEQALTQLQAMMGQAPSFEDYQASPYSQFLQKQGLESIEAKSRAGGYYNTGATSKEMMQYAQDIAGQDYQQYLSNYYQSLNPYMSMAGLGQSSTAQLGSMGAQTAGAIGNYASQAASATAAGITGAANAQAQGLQNLLGTAAFLYAAA